MFFLVCFDIVDNRVPVQGSKNTERIWDPGSKVRV